MVTTSGTVTIQKVLRAGVATAYTIENASLFMKHNEVQKRFTATSITNATTVSSGLITFANVPLWGDGSYSLYITVENNNDIDTNGVQLSKIATGYIKKITNVATLTI